MAEKTHWEEEPKDAGDELVSGTEKTISESDRKAAFYDDALESFYKQIQAAEEAGNLEEADRLRQELGKFNAGARGGHGLYGEEEHRFEESLEKVLAEKGKQRLMEKPSASLDPIGAHEREIIAQADGLRTEEYLREGPLRSLREKTGRQLERTEKFRLATEKAREGFRRLGKGAQEIVKGIYKGAKENIADRAKIMFASPLYELHEAEEKRLQGEFSVVDTRIKELEDKSSGGELGSDEKTELLLLRDRRDSLNQRMEYRKKLKDSYEEFKRWKLARKEMRIRRKLDPFEAKIAEIDRKGKEVDAIIANALAKRKQKSVRFAEVQDKISKGNLAPTERRVAEKELDLVFEELRKGDAAIKGVKRERFRFENELPKIEDKVKPRRDKLAALRAIIEGMGPLRAEGAVAVAPETPAPPAPGKAPSGSAPLVESEETLSSGEKFYRDLRESEEVHADPGSFYRDLRGLEERFGDRGEKIFTAEQYFEEWSRQFGEEIPVSAEMFFKASGLPHGKMRLDIFEESIKGLVHELVQNGTVDAIYEQSLLPQRLQAVRLKLENKS